MPVSCFALTTFCAPRWLLWTTCWLALAGGAWRPLRVAADAIDDFVETERARQRIPGLALLVIQGDQTLKSAGYGLADLEHEVPVTAETMFQSGSIGKQFTATAIMLLAGDGKLALDDRLRKYLPGAPAAWGAITLRQLLSHTAGLGDYPPGFDLRRDRTEAQLLETIYQTKLAFPPGTDWRYSNLGYIVLGAVIRQASGQFYGDFLRERVFAPAGMPTARVISEEDIVLRRARGYRVKEGTWKNQEWVAPQLNTTADGSLYLSLVDWAAWDRALRGDAVLPQAKLAEMWTVAPLADGRPNKANYGFGWMVQDLRGHRLVQHGGAWQGFHTHLLRWLDDGLTVGVFTNLSADSGSNPGKIARRVSELVLPELASPERPQIPDPQPELTARLGERLSRLTQGQAQAEWFADPARAAIFPDHLADVAEQFAPLGELSPLELLEREEQGDALGLIYRARFARGDRLVLRLKLTADERIAEIDLTDEE